MRRLSRAASRRPDSVRRLVCTSGRTLLSVLQETSSGQFSIITFCVCRFCVFIFCFMLFPYLIHRYVGSIYMTKMYIYIYIYMCLHSCKQNGESCCENITQRLLFECTCVDQRPAFKNITDLSSETNATPLIHYAIPSI